MVGNSNSSIEAQNTEQNKRFKAKRPPLNKLYSIRLKDFVLASKHRTSFDDSFKCKANIDLQKLQDFGFYFKRSFEALHLNGLFRCMSLHC